MVAVVSVGRKGQLTIPADLRRAAGLQPGHVLSIEMTEHGLVLRPVKTDPDQAWFWTPAWQAKEREADRAKAEGRFTRFYSDEDFLASLK